VIILTLKIYFLFIGIWFTIINTSNVIAKKNISAINIIYQAIGITGFITVMFLI